MVDDDLNVPRRWFLGNLRDRQGVEVDPGLFTIGRSVENLDECIIDVRDGKKALGFTFSDFDAPVVDATVLALLKELCGRSIQTIPVAVSGHRDRYWMLNVTTVVDCIDESATEIERWTADDEEPERVGQIRGLANLTIDPARAAGAELFRPKGWEIQLLASSRVHDAMTRAKVAGVQFVPVGLAGLSR